MVVIAAFGNPLLDMAVKINGTELLKKYNLNEDDQIEFDQCQMKSLVNDIKNFSVEYTPGGCAQNTLRIFQWLCGPSTNTYMIGGIGNDANGKILKELVENAGVHTMYVPDNKLPTGISVALINQENRSLIASIGAAESVDIDSFNKITNNWELLQNVTLFYMEGFFIPKREIFAKHILNFSKSTNRLFAFNISAPYICKQNQSIVSYFAENCDVLFGNMKEYASLLESMHFRGNVLDFAIDLSKSNGSICEYRKVIVITNGSKSAVCVHSGGQICEVDVPSVPTSEIKDTTGAGDSFVAGFLFALFKNCTPVVCLKFGCWTAHQIIKQIGCKVPDYSPDWEKLK